MTVEPKFCKDCKHFKEAGSVGVYGSSFSWPNSCNQPPELDLIHGRKTPADPAHMRADGGACKPEALLWEEQPAPTPTQPPLAVIHEYHKQWANAAVFKPYVEQRIAPQPRWWEFWK